MNKYILNVLVAMALVSCSNSVTEKPIWLEDDSQKAISQRTLSDFSLTIDEAKAILLGKYPSLTDEKIEEYIFNKYLEVKIINGERRMHRKSPDNLILLCPDLRGEWPCRGFDATPTEISIVDSIVAKSKGDGVCSNKYKVRYSFFVDVPKHDFLIGDTLRVWVPLPIESARQSNVKILSSTPDNYVISTGKSSVHNTIYYEIPVTEESDSIIHFEYNGEYDVSAQYFSPDFIMKNIKPYDTSSHIYKQYTSVELPHIVRMDSLANVIVGDEKCPYKQSELVYDYIISRYAWAGAREYSTIECLPQYVIDECHGDCGQVSLLYISLMRSLGVPARWESGWMLHPGQKNLHDWAEVYFEGIGWVPVDVSFGRFIKAKDIRTTKFFSTGLDQYRFASNLGVCGELYPAKKFLRSETVDFQLGEVECNKGNLFYPGWKKGLKILEMTQID